MDGVRRFTMDGIADTLLSAKSTLTTKLGIARTALEAKDINYQRLRDVTRIASSNMGHITSNITNLASAASLDGIQASMADLQNASLGGLQASLGGIQKSVAGLEGLSRSFVNTIAENRKSLINEESLKKKGNFQLLATIRTIEYQILMITLYFILAFSISWYWTAGVEHTKTMVTMVRNAKDALDDPKLELKIRQMQADIQKYSDLKQLKEGIGELAQSIAHSAEKGRAVIGGLVSRDNAGSSDPDKDDAVTITD